MIVNGERVLKVTEAAKFLSVYPDTLRRWDNEGIFKTLRTPKGTRIYKIRELRKLIK